MKRFRVGVRRWKGSTVLATFRPGPARLSRVSWVTGIFLEEKVIEREHFSNRNCARLFPDSCKDLGTVHWFE